MIKVSNLHKAYQSLEVLKGVDLTINNGEILSIVGSSGAGKTTLLQILGTLESPSKGTVYFGDIDIFKLKEKELAKFRNTEIGFIFQFHQLLPEFNAVENAILPALIKGVSKEEAIQQAEALFRILHIEHRKDHFPNELSGGEQQRVAIARALINNPKYVFADEPSGNLDSQNAKELHQLFFDLREKFGTAFIIVTHNQELADMADRKLTMKDGIIAE
ncbi:MAG: ABC transporter ATP-binding protein [Flavobacteriia bacterium]|nr:ABC transporter ATP-binding protein [Flavobacteriia bacterium]OJX39095.1 MAG: lipoprotein ABC transporter ATP-binding protein [Flavobacteriia bacterium 40-80]